MKRFFPAPSCARPAVLAALVCLAAACSPGDRTETSDDNNQAAARADLFISGGPIYTGLDSKPQAEAVAVKDGRIVAVGSMAEIAPYKDGAETIDLDGAALYPGFTDAHAHLFGIGMRELTLNLEGVGSVDELVDIVAANVGEAKPGDVIYGRGWIETGWPEGRFPNRDDLDEVSPDNPLVLIRADGHAAVVNSAALEKAGIDQSTADPDGGRIERDSDGRATGMLIDNAMQLAGDLFVELGEAPKREAYRLGGSVYAAYGWTGVHNMSVDPDDVSIMEDLAGNGDLPIRVYNALDSSGLDWLAENAPARDATGRIITRAMKLYADGSLGSRGAALSEPYADEPDTRGLLLMQKSDALPLMERALRAGVQVATHAIGDRGNKLTLDWYEEAFAAVPEEERAVADPRWRVEHAQTLHQNDIPRFAQLGVIASMQPSHAIGDLYFAPDRLGMDRLAGAYAWRDLIDAGAIVPGGSDAPVERGDPRIEFYAAVARRGLDGFQGEGWHPEEAVTRAEALKMFTLWPAIASFQEDDLGVIEVGKKADFTGFSADIMTIPESEIIKVKPVLTVIDGAVVFKAE